MTKHTCKLLGGRLLHISSNKLEQVFTIFTTMASLGPKEFWKHIRKKAIEVLDLGAEGHRRKRIDFPELGVKSDMDKKKLHH